MQYSSISSVAVEIVMQNIIGETLDVNIQLLSSTETSRLMSLYKSLCHSRSINIMMSLGLPLLQELSSAGPSKVVHWSLYSGLLSFSPILGYSIGPMLAKVMSAVFADDDPKNNSKSSINDGADISTESLEGSVERVIKLSRTQDTSSSMENVPLPPEGCFPVMWGKVVNIKLVFVLMYLRMSYLYFVIVVSSSCGSWRADECRCRSCRR
jgi:hypothetical protein